MASIKRIRSLRGVGILADRRASEPGPDFLRYNLIYGFNGSGKSTVSRIFASLEQGERDHLLPESSVFEVEMEGGRIYRSSGTLQTREDEFCVFSSDFVSRNLQWDEGRANSVFYISEQQADLVENLKAAEADLIALRDKNDAEQRVFSEREKAFRTYRTERAKLVSSRLHLGNRKYEAGQLRGDYEALEQDNDLILPPDLLDRLEGIARLSAPMPPLNLINVDIRSMRVKIESARYCAEVRVGTAMLSEIESHPSMAEWLKAGFDFHEKHKLSDCLFCGNRFTDRRKRELAKALEGRLGHLFSVLKKAESDIADANNVISQGILSWPKRSDLDPKFQSDYEAQMVSLRQAIGELHAVIEEAQRITRVRQQDPIDPIQHGIPHEEKLDALCEALRDAVSATNRVIGDHNAAISEFESRQEEARLSIRKHYFAEGYEEYTSMRDAVSEAGDSVGKIQSEIEALVHRIADLKSKVRTHGPAAEQISKLVHAYLGHAELTVVAVDEGYELHRNKQLVKGPPSEGEKTAIALCYFLSTLQAEGRRLRDLIVVVDDPISSLDTKAMNYACALILSQLKSASQVFVLTHNQHCMNEFKKAWKGLAEPRNAATNPTAALLFMDVTMTEGKSHREARLVAMPPLLKAYDSEYHFLCQKVIEFEAAGEGHSDYGFMMPNVIRRVLEVFLAFKVPGSGPIKDKLSRLCEQHEGLDATRFAALERLSQVESHSDNLDDLISHSSTTIEEARAANAALLDLMMVADSSHTTAIRRQCRVRAGD